MSLEKRLYPRRKLDQTACIEVPILCKLFDVSRSGACLTVDAPAALPTEFMLHLNADLHCWCRVVWRKDHQVGVEFEATPAQYLDWLKDQGAAQATGDT
jgi:hypothetical protein